MSMIRVVGIDIAKSVFQVCVWMNDGSVAWNKKISRSRLQDTDVMLKRLLRETFSQWIIQYVDISN
ncbi:hypothetical protein ACG755_005089 [Klebsiella variicola]